MVGVWWWDCACHCCSRGVGHLMWLGWNEMNYVSRSHTVLLSLYYGGLKGVGRLHATCKLWSSSSMQHAFQQALSSAVQSFGFEGVHGAMGG